MGYRGSGRYARGDNAVAICERCSNKVLRRILVYDGQYPDLLVCPTCWDPKHPQEYLPPVTDPITIYDPTGDPDRAVANVVKISLPLSIASDGLTVIDPLDPLAVRVQINEQQFNLVSNPEPKIVIPAGVFEPDTLFHFPSPTTTRDRSKSNCHWSARGGGGAVAISDDFRKFPGHRAMFFDGTNAILQFMTDSPRLSEGGGLWAMEDYDWTLETHIHPLTVSGQRTIFSIRESTTQQFVWSIDGGILEFEYTENGSSYTTLVSDLPAVLVDEYSEVSVQRRGDELTFFLNGVPSSPHDLTGVVFNNPGNDINNDPPMMGGHSSITSPGGDFHGYITEFRYSGVARYTSAGYTPHTSPFPTSFDPDKAAVVLHLPLVYTPSDSTSFDPNSTEFSGLPNESGFNPDSRNIDTVFGNSGARNALSWRLFSNSEISYPNSSRWDLAGDFTMEIDLLFITSFTDTDVAGDSASAHMSHWLATGDQRSWCFQVNKTNGDLEFCWTTDGINEQILAVPFAPTAKGSGNGIDLSIWDSVCVERFGSLLRFYINGEPQGEAQELTDTIYVGTAAFFLHGVDGNLADERMGGSRGMNHARITNVARYQGASYTIPDTGWLVE